jgi:hypothetical protein
MKKGSKQSEETKRKIAEAQKKRWASEPKPKRRSKAELAAEEKINEGVFKVVSTQKKQIILVPREAEESQVHEQKETELGPLGPEPEDTEEKDPDWIENKFHWIRFGRSMMAHAVDPRTIKRKEKLTLCGLDVSSPYRTRVARYKSAEHPTCPHCRSYVKLIHANDWKIGIIGDVW